MVFSSLPVDYQNVMLEQYSYMSKWLVFSLLLGLSLYYVFFVWKKQELTRFFSVVAYRLLFISFSVGFLVASPFMLLLMTPDYSFLDFYGVVLKFYQVVIIISFVVLLVDFLRYGFLGILKVGGLDFGDENVNSVVNDIKKSRHFMKFGGIRKKW